MTEIVPIEMSNFRIRMYLLNPLMALTDTL